MSKFNSELLGCFQAYLTGLDAMDVLRVRIPLHHSCADYALGNKAHNNTSEAMQPQEMDRCSLCHRKLFHT